MELETVKWIALILGLWVVVTDVLAILGVKFAKTMREKVLISYIALLIIACLTIILLILLSILATDRDFNRMVHDASMVMVPVSLVLKAWKPEAVIVTFLLIFCAACAGGAAAWIVIAGRFMSDRACLICTTLVCLAGALAVAVMITLGALAWITAVAPIIP